MLISSASYDKLLAMATAHPAQLFCFFIALFFFHTSEFLLAFFIHGSSKVSTSSFLLSKQYLVAMVCGMVEYGMEGIFLPQLKAHMQISYIGLAIIILGEAVRKSAILTAKHNFTHDIKIYHQENHELVTHGVYRLVRHPSYLGFFLWSIGTQVLLVNPICTVGYAIVTWRYFAQRIQYPLEANFPFYALCKVKVCAHGYKDIRAGLHLYSSTKRRINGLIKARQGRFVNAWSLPNLFKCRYEEYFLRQFFGKQYTDYAKSVPSGIPFVDYGGL